MGPIKFNFNIIKTKLWSINKHIIKCKASQCIKILFLGNLNSYANLIKILASECLRLYKISVDDEVCDSVASVGTTVYRLCVSEPLCCECDKTLYDMVT